MSHSTRLTLFVVQFNFKSILWHPIGAKPHSCDKCGKKFKQSYELLKHRTMVHHQTARKSCDKNHTAPAARKKHKSITHANELNISSSIRRISSNRWNNFILFISCQVVSSFLTVSRCHASYHIYTEHSFLRRILIVASSTIFGLSPNWCVVSDASFC